MKSKTVETIVSNEEYVRLRIYDGDLPIDEAGTELLRIERAQHAATQRRLRSAEAKLSADEDADALDREGGRSPSVLEMETNHPGSTGAKTLAPGALDSRYCEQVRRHMLGLPLTASGVEVSGD